MSLSVNFFTHNRELTETYQQVRTGDPDKEWAVFGYDKGTNDLKVLEVGGRWNEHVRPREHDTLTSVATRGIILQLVWTSWLKSLATARFSMHSRGLSSLQADCPSLFSSAGWVDYDTRSITRPNDQTDRLNSAVRACQLKRKAYLPRI